MRKTVSGLSVSKVNPIISPFSEDMVMDYMRPLQNRMSMGAKLQNKKAQKIMSDDKMNEKGIKQGSESGKTQKGISRLKRNNAEMAFSFKPSWRISSYNDNQPCCDRQRNG